MSNLELWDKVCVTEIDTTKNFKGKGGFQGTAVCAQSQRKKATEIFGIYGIGWKVEKEEYKIVSFTDDHYSKLFYTADIMFIYNDKTGSFPIASEIDVFNYSQKYKSWSMGNDLYKKVRTDAMTKGLSELGFNADIFEGKFDDNKYIQELKQEQNITDFNRDEALKKIDALMIELKCDENYIKQLQSQFPRVKNQKDFEEIQSVIRRENNG